ncbi:unnamed protein product [Paramecium sonneborni]|uniref:Uncharacterized protein n=1 Tax=Paramecium sonneborni TaxID=65129 RepID=A0A8S1LX16_9CILI|nr:unnamed protein product [Paramecium sonneborni]
MSLGSISVIQILFVQPIILYQTCVDYNINDCENHGWSLPGKVFDCSGNLIIGNYIKEEIVEKKFEIPPHQLLRFSVTIYKIDSWDNEGFEISANDNIIYTKILGDQDGNGNLCGQTAWNDMPFYYEKEMKISEYELQVKFQNHLDQGLDDEQWGFRNFTLEILIPCVNFYAECNYQGELFQMCQGDKTQFQSEIPFEIRSIRMNNNTVIILRGPHYSGGNTQQYTTSQPCLDSYKFPKVLQVE